MQAGLNDTGTRRFANNPWLIVLSDVGVLYAITARAASPYGPARAARPAMAIAARPAMAMAIVPAFSPEIISTGNFELPQKYVWRAWPPWQRREAG
jgi:hypothetical protein